MSSRIRKSSSRVTLVLLGAAALAACGQDGTQRRDVYAQKDDCIKDWGDEAKCEEQSVPGRGGGSHGGFWYGPMYRSGEFGSGAQSQPHGTVDSARPGSRAVATSHVSRGGFGGSGAAHASSGT